MLVKKRAAFSKGETLFSEDNAIFWLSSVNEMANRAIRVIHVAYTLTR